MFGQKTNVFKEKFRSFFVEEVLPMTSPSTRDVIAGVMGNYFLFNRYPVIKSAGSADIGRVVMSADEQVRTNKKKDLKIWKFVAFPLNRD